MSGKALTAGIQTGSAMNHIYSRAADQVPVVGMGVTRLCWTDRHAYTLIEILSEKKLRIQRDTVTRVDSNGMSDSQAYEYAPNPSGATCIITLRKNGRWCQEGQDSKSEAFMLGMRKEYYDFGF
jgi:hypothetical protein